MNNQQLNKQETSPNIGNVRPQTQKELATVQDGQPKQKNRLKSKCRLIIIGLVISICAVQFGYSVKQITSVPLPTLLKQYDITINQFIAQSILIGILPIGSIFGAIITDFLLKRFRRLAAIYAFVIANLGAIILVNIQSFETLIVGRFIQGICIGYYSAMAPIYLREIAPKQLRRMLGLFFSFGKTVGILLCIYLQQIFIETQTDISWRIILSMSAVFAILLAILIFIFGSNTPTEMIENDNQPQALKIIQDLYLQEYVDEVMNEYRKQVQMEKHKQGQHPAANSRQLQNITQQSPVENREPNKIETNQSLKVRQEQIQLAQSPHKMTFAEKKRQAYYVSMNLCLIRHMIGGNTIISQGGIFITLLNPTLGRFTALIINMVLMVFIIIGIVWVQKYIGKRPLFLFSISSLAIMDLALAVAMIGKNVEAMQIIMCFYMVVYGLAFISPIWAYPSEVVPANQSLLGNVLNWVGLAVSLLVPPIVAGQMPDNNPFPVFIFFGIYGLCISVYIFFKLRESDGKTYDEIIESFK